MKEFNFNTLRDLPVPESWIENAFAIPENADREPASIPFWRKPRFIATAASLLLVTALSVGLFLSMGGKTPVPVKPDAKPSATEIIWSTNASGETVATEVVPADGQVQPHPTEQKSTLQRLIDRVLGTGDAPSPTTAPGTDRRDAPSPTTSPGTNRRGASPTTSQSPTQSGRANPSQASRPSDGIKPAETTAPIASLTEPEVTPTEPPVSPTDAVEPTERQPYEPQMPPTESPWVHPYPSEGPTEACGEQPTDSQQTIQPLLKRRVLYVSIPQAEVPSDGVIYCILTVDGAVLGEDDLYADERRMTFLAYGTSYTFYYVISDHITIPASAEGKTATYEVYDSSGNLLKTGSYQLR